jgi:hypothetical protein
MSIQRRLQRLAERLLVEIMIRVARLQPSPVKALPEILECLEKDFARAMGMGDETQASDQPPRNAMSAT